MCFLVAFHDELLEFLVLVFAVIVVWAFIFLRFSGLWGFWYNNHLVEIVWTSFPLFLLFFFIAPSLNLLFSLDENQVTGLSYNVKAIQWDWEISIKSFGYFSCWEDFNLINRLSFSDSFRLFETFNAIFVICGVNSFFELSSEDVLHSFTVPSLGFKLDCAPGKTGLVNFFAFSSGIYHGHCAEICGANHSIIPVEVVSASGGSLFKNVCFGGKWWFSPCNTFERFFSVWFILGFLLYCSLVYIYLLSSAAFFQAFLLRFGCFGFFFV